MTLPKVLEAETRFLKARRAQAREEATVRGLRREAARLLAEADELAQEITEHTAAIASLDKHVSRLARHDSATSVSAASLETYRDGVCRTKRRRAGRRKAFDERGKRSNKLSNKRTRRAEHLKALSALSANHAKLLRQATYLEDVKLKVARKTLWHVRDQCGYFDARHNYLAALADERQSDLETSSAEMARLIAVTDIGHATLGDVWYYQYVTSRGVTYTHIFYGGAGSPDGEGYGHYVLREQGGEVKVAYKRPPCLR